MPMRPCPSCLLLAAITVAAVAAQDPRTVSPRASDLSYELLAQRCVSELSSWDLTLFVNGTLRLREEPHERPGVMLLAELTVPEVDAYRRRLAGIDLGDEAEMPTTPLVGENLEQCSLTVELERGRPRAFRFSRFDAPSLALGQLQRIAGELQDVARERAVREGVPASYRGRIGDLLRREDGVVFEVTGFTVGDLGLELTGVEQPLRIYVPLEALRGGSFVLIDESSWP